jgi:SAM-dependent methyltransferase
VGHFDRNRRATWPGIRTAVARAEALPLADGSADLVTFAQAWHWVDVERATVEVVRVCRPAGALVVWWNDVDARGERWWEDQQDRIEAANAHYERGYRDEEYAGPLLATGRFASAETWTGRWERRIDLDTYERWLRSKSYVAAIGDGVEEFVAAERASLGRAFPDGVVREPFRVRAYVARIA